MSSIPLNDGILNNETGITITAGGILAAGVDLGRIVNMIKCGGTPGTVRLFNGRTNQTIDYPISAGELVNIAYSKLVSVGTASGLFWYETGENFNVKSKIE